MYEYTSVDLLLNTGELLHGVLEIDNGHAIIEGKTYHPSNIKDVKDSESGNNFPNWEGTW